MSREPKSPKAKPSRQKSTVRHTRAIRAARTKRQNSSPPDEVIAARLTDLVHPATLAQMDHFRALGLRERLLTLPGMMALVLSLIWRQVSGVSELLRIVRNEVVLWQPPVQVSQQAFSQRLGSLPADLFARVFQTLLPQIQARWSARGRPLPPEVAWAQAHYEQVLIADGSTLDALLRQVGLLQQSLSFPLAGRMLALLDLGSRLPRQVWYEEDAAAHDQRFWPQVLAHLRAGTLLIFDLGFTNFGHFAQLTTQQVTFITRAKTNLKATLIQSFRHLAALHDDLVWIGAGTDRQQVRRIQVLFHGRWYRYLTNELDPLKLPPEYVVALYYQRWRIEEAYALVKRLLGLAYFWSGAINAIQLQVWATWILYAVLIDLTDEVADHLKRPCVALSVEMVYRGLYHFTQAYHRGETVEVVAYLAANADWLGILKRPRRTASPPPLRVLQQFLTSSLLP
jgi:hypothetical protein